MVPADPFTFALTLSPPRLSRRQNHFSVADGNLSFGRYKDSTYRPRGMHVFGGRHQCTNFDAGKDICSSVFCCSALS